MVPCLLFQTGVHLGFRKPPERGSTNTDDDIGDHMQHMHRAREPIGKYPPVVQRQVGCLTEVCGHENRLKRDHSLFP